MSIFNKVLRSKLPSNVFKDLSYSNKFDAQIGMLYPVHVEEIVPGDVFYAGHGAMIRSQPMVTPVFHNFNYNLRYFFVPNRLVWKNFESFITDQEKGSSVPGLVNPHVHPYLASKLSLNYLHDLFGVSPMNGASDFTGQSSLDYYSANVPIDALPFRAYYLIWNEFFKDENTMDDLPLSLEDGADDTQFELQRVSWKKDYFTSALPWAQRGDAVQFLTNVYYAAGDINGGHQRLIGNGEMVWSAESPVNNEASVSPDMNGGAGVNMHLKFEGYDYGSVDIDPNGTLHSAIPFAAIRQATALQRFLERSAQGGNRYAELLLAHFGVRSSDASLQRPQYLGGGVVPINISPVEQNSGTTEVSPQGTLAGKGVGVGTMYMNRPTLFTEHGWLIAVAYIRPDADYVNGIRRQLVKHDRFDYYWPDFQNIGEQEVKNYELFVTDDGDKNSDSFGYQSRYAHYKWHGNEVHGQFRSSLRSWVAPREFGEIPTLSQKFIECDLDISDNMAISPTVYPPFMIESLNVVNARRPMYYFNRGVL